MSPQYILEQWWERPAPGERSSHLRVPIVTGIYLAGAQRASDLSESVTAVVKLNQTPDIVNEPEQRGRLRFEPQGLMVFNELLSDYRYRHAM